MKQCGLCFAVQRELWGRGLILGLEMSEIIPKIWMERRFDAGNSSDFPTLDSFL